MAVVKKDKKGFSGNPKGSKKKYVHKGWLKRLSPEARERYYAAVRKGARIGGKHKPKDPILKQINNKMEGYTVEENENKKKTMVDQVKEGMEFGQATDPEGLTFWKRVFKTAHVDESVMKCIISAFPKELLAEVCGYEGVEADEVTIITYRNKK